MYEFVDLLLQKRRYLIVVAMVALELMLSSLLSSAVQAHRGFIEARIRASNSGQSSQIASDSPNAVTNALAQLADDIGGGSNAAELKILGDTITLTDDLTRMNAAAEHGAYVASMFTYHSEADTIKSTMHVATKGVADTADAVGTGISDTTDAVGGGISDTARAVGTGFSNTTGTTGNGVTYIINTERGIFDFNVNLVRNMGGFAFGLAHVSSVIRPTDSTPVPTITELRIQQAALIQSGTQDVTIASLTSGTGGACDNGDGNGGYPMFWCNAPMDSVSTIAYTSDPINRECTSYAYWYFTVIEGHTNFRVWDDARYWASTSNYPSHAMPAVGALAVETAGAYGHVAVVQALPGQKFAGQVVPAGYLLVSEMNYDWSGHFRYSYSPISKFSAYIY